MHDRRPVARPQQHRPADAGLDVVGQLQQRLEPLLELGQDVHLADRPAALVRLDPVALPVGIVASGTAPCR